ncbi:MAG: ABC transporter ATP-binding protein [Actinomycetia bacterium]|nr:ABC transporter ATP-binding protein [Actinomycetes bacterium]
MLEIKNLEVLYGKIKAIKDISLYVKSKEIVTIIGANGAGKTTLLKTISGILKASEGSIIFHGERITNHPPAVIVKKGISQVPEGRKIFPKMTVYENLEMGAFSRRDSEHIKGDIEKIFSYFPILAERKNQEGGTLSGGEQQMLAISRGLIAKPKLLLLDEPSLGLAPFLIEEIFLIIKNINETGTTILLVEQNAYMALQIASRAYVLETGKIALEGNAKDLLNNEHVKKAYLGG